MPAVSWAECAGHQKRGQAGRRPGPRLRSRRGGGRSSTSDGPNGSHGARKPDGGRVTPGAWQLLALLVFIGAVWALSVLARTRSGGSGRVATANRAKRAAAKRQNATTIATAANQRAVSQAPRAGGVLRPRRPARRAPQPDFGPPSPRDDALCLARSFPAAVPPLPPASASSAIAAVSGLEGPCL